ncbi:FG-GAP-like repeat-containing protein [Streptomyces sp. NPDC001407]|uniref:C40 family peptidase n=1 Tax=Streptomyces sp. NPDC001407 TaxID=3364573 RepID=UPI003680744A
MKISRIGRASSIAALVTTALAFTAVGTVAPTAVADSRAAAASGTQNDHPSSGQGTSTSELRRKGLVPSSLVAKPITRSETLRRAASWFGKGLHYSGDNTYQGWRTDCSGFVSMAWGLPGPGETTDSFIPGGVAHEISKDELKPGDALNNKALGNDGHVVLFEKWADSSQSSYWGYEFSSSGLHHRVIPYAYFSRSEQYRPIRFNTIVDDDTAAGPAEDNARVQGDFDGDGRDDVAVLYDYGRKDDRSRSALWTFNSNGSGFNSPKQVWDSGTTESWNWASSKLTVGDFNGDGKADIGVLYNMGATEDGRNRTKLFVFTSTGSGFAAPVKVWDSNDDPVKSWNWNASKLTVGDFNGDGKADIGVLYDYGKDDDHNRTGLWTFTSTGSGFNSPKQMWDSNNDAVKSWNWEASKPVSGDFNGDGKADIGVLYDYGKTDSGSRTGLWTFNGNGNGFNSPKQVWDSNNDPVKSWNWEAGKPVSGDFNGDGKSDIGVLYDMGRTEDGRNRTKLFTFTGTATGFNSPVKVWDSNDDPVKSWNASASKPVAGDFNGDGKADIGVLYDYGKTDSGNRSGLWTFTSNGSGSDSPKLGWDSSADPVKSWNWSASKLG